MPKSWWDNAENKVNDDDSPEEIERKQLYFKLCASKKPYFFAYNYTFLKKEYDDCAKTAQSNAVALYGKNLAEMLDLYENGELEDENEVKFIKNYLYKLPLDMSKSTMNRICWAIEKEFDHVDLFSDVYFDYDIMKSGNAYDAKTYEVIKYICKTYKSNTRLAQKRAATCIGTDAEDEWWSADMILRKLVEDLEEQCSNEDELCDILIDLCYRDGMPKSILWTASGDVIYRRLLKQHDYKISYPQKDDNGDFWCQGKCYSMREIIVKDGDDDEVSIQ